MPFEPMTNLDEVRLLKATERMNEALAFLDRFSAVTWKEVKDFITVGVFDSQKQRVLLGKLGEWSRAYPRPASVPTLETELRIAVSESFHNAERIGGLTALGSMVFERDIPPTPWRIYNPALVVANFREGNFGRISGEGLGAGKTNTGCYIMEQWVATGTPEEPHVAISNILPKEDDPRYIYVKDARALFLAIADLPAKAVWLFVLDEAGPIWSKGHATETRAKELNDLARILRKLHGSLVLIEQRAESVPTIIQELATSVFQCLGADRDKKDSGVVFIELKGPFLAFRATVKNFPRTTLPYDTYDPAFFSVNVDVRKLWESLSGAPDQKAALRSLIEEMDAADEEAAEGEKPVPCQEPGCDQTFVPTDKRLRYCPSHRRRNKASGSDAP